MEKLDNSTVVWGHVGQFEERRGFGQTHPWAFQLLVKEIWLMEMHRADAFSLLITCICFHLLHSLLRWSTYGLCVFS